MSRETDDELSSQGEAAQRATPGGAREEAVPERPDWRTAASRAVDRVFDLPVWARALIGLGVAGLASLVPFVIPYFSAIPEYWMNIMTEVGIAALLALGL